MLAQEVHEEQARLDHGIALHPVDGDADGNRQTRRLVRHTHYHSVAQDHQLPMVPQTAAPVHWARYNAADSTSPERGMPVSEQTYLQVALEDPNQWELHCGEL